VGKGDVLRFDSANPKRIWIKDTEGFADLPLLPAFSLTSAATVGEINYDVAIRELADASDVEAYDYLEQFHYKTSLTADGDDADSTPTQVGGRKAILLLTIRHGRRWLPAGYVELQMPLLMVKPRHEFFQAPFCHSQRPIEWLKWEQNEIRRNTNLIVRVGRIVVSPEYRGLGLAKTLIKAASMFASQRWHIGGRKPLFMEISAEMLNYINFVSTAGFSFIGMTEGNVKRVAKDLHYMRRRYDVSSGIMSLQRKYLSAFERICADTGRSFDEELQKLRAVADGEVSLNSLDPGEWYAFRKVLRFPRPYYLLGLDDDTRRYLKSPAVGVSPPTADRVTSYVAAPMNVKIARIRSIYSLPATPNVRMITDSFGIEAHQISREIVGAVTIKAAPGNIVFVAGASGSGKSVVLKALDGMTVLPHLKIEYEHSPRGQYSVGWLKPIEGEAALIEVFAERYGADRTITAFSRVGLSEAFVFLKPFALLSRGQRYRAMLADLMLRDDPVWLIDEFCADLDPVAASIVAHNLRRLVLREGRIAVIAAANHAHFLKALRPSQVLVLRAGDSAEQLTHREYSESYLGESRA
jgi:ABC-type transport system involved in cytochrome c biogenesis ATPase subunit/GNAT superfamily N-acetyltransferase